MSEISIFKAAQSAFFGKYPYDIHDSELPVIVSTSFELGSENQRIILFNASQSLYVDSIYHCVKSVFDRGDYLKLSRNGQVTEKELVTSYHQNSGYKSIHYDRYRNVYYIIYKHEVLTEDPNIMQSPFSIIVLNENFEVLGESEFPANTYDFLHMHVIPKGILLLKENPYNPKNLEEFLEADIVTINL